MKRETKILLVDDEISFTQTMAFWFESKGYTVESASNGQAAIEVIKKNPPDIVFLDLNMPVMDGAQTLCAIRAFDKTLPVIIISAYLEDQKMMNAVRECGISGVFYKGKDFEKCLPLLDAALRTHKGLKKDAE